MSSRLRLSMLITVLSPGGSRLICRTIRFSSIKSDCGETFGRAGSSSAKENVDLVGEMMPLSRFDTNRDCPASRGN